MIAEKRKTVVLAVIVCLALIVTIGAVTFTGAEARVNITKNENVPNTDLNAAPSSVPSPEPSNEKNLVDYFALGVGTSHDFLVEAVENNFFAVPETSVIASSNGITMALSRYILTTEHARFVFQIDGLADDNIRSVDQSGMGNAVNKLILTDEAGNQIYDFDLSKVQTDFFFTTDIYKTLDGVYLEIVLENPDNDSGQILNLKIPKALNIEIYGISGSEDGQWRFRLPVDDKFINYKPLYYEATNLEYCEENGVYVDNFYSTANATRMEVTVDSSKNSIEQPSGDLGFVLFEDPNTHASYKKPYEQKLFVIANGEQLFETAKIDHGGEQLDTMSKYNGEYRTDIQTDKGIKYFLYLPTLYFANADNVTVRILDQNRKPIEVKLRKTENPPENFQDNVIYADQSSDNSARISENPDITAQNVDSIIQIMDNVNFDACLNDYLDYGVSFDKENKTWMFNGKQIGFIYNINTQIMFVNLPVSVDIGDSDLLDELTKLDYAFLDVSYERVGVIDRLVEINPDTVIRRIELAKNIPTVMVNYSTKSVSRFN